MALVLLPVFTFVMHKRRHFVIMGVIILFFILQAILAAAGIVKFNVV